MSGEHMNTVSEILVSILILGGAFFALVGSFGLARLPDFFMRLHGPAKATTLGVGSIIIGSVIFFSTRGEGLSLHELLIALFLFITAPISAHIVAKAALHLKLPCIEKTLGQNERGSRENPVQ
jgi:multicomponent K+:H+ antiporter subunit G